MRNDLRRIAALILTALAVILSGLILWAHEAHAQPADLVSVNADVNRSIRYRSDLDQYGLPELWIASPPSGEGDCEDYALTKQARLNGRGEIVVVGWQHPRFQRQRGWHAVLVVDGWVLDNIERRVVPVTFARTYYAGL